MVSIQLEPDQEKRLIQLAQHRGQDVADLARRILADYLDFQALSGDSEADWAAASVALAPEVFDDERWDEPSNGS